MNASARSELPDDTVTLPDRLPADRAYGLTDSLIGRVHLMHSAH
jgi:hypothetical protein